MSQPSLALFDPYIGGHHPEHLYHLVNYWQKEWGILEIVTPKKNLRAFDKLSQLTEETNSEGIRWHPLPDRNQRKGIKKARAYHQLLRTYVTSSKAPHILLMHIDHLQVSLALDLRFKRNVNLSGLLFRPNFHYSDFASSPPRTPKEVLRDLKKRYLLKAALGNPHLDTVFSLDPFCITMLQKWSKNVTVRRLPDPVAPFAEAEESGRERQAGAKRMMLLFGSLSQRKGILELLKACKLLSAEVTNDLHLCLAGRLDDTIRAEARALIDQVENESSLTVQLVDDFIPFDQCYSFFREADLVLLPYQRHIGMSGILVRAAAAGKPVLCQDYGLMGKMVEHHSLGWIVDTTSPQAIADALTKWRQDSLTGFSIQSARQFASSNEPAKYAHTIYSSILA